MSCYHPIVAWRSSSGTVTLGKEPPDSQKLGLPCGSCLGCRQDEARGWALRSHLEMQRHAHTVFTTLTYARDPKILWKPDLQLWLKRLRKAVEPTRIRFFAVGEYGERFKRPHYHALLFGLGQDHAEQIEKTWGHGYTKTIPATPACIAYVAGYCQKKIGWKLERRVDDETGEVVWEPPFRLMSRGGRHEKKGLGGHARDDWPTSWRDHAVLHGQRMPVPRYLHAGWREKASQEERERLEYERYRERALRGTLTQEETQQRLKAKEALAVARQNLRAARRKYEG